MTRDDVRSSLALLDSVIGEFDDGGGATSAAESEPPIERKLIQRPPPPPIHKNKRIADKIDNIFSELTQEVDGAKRKSSTRRVDDPLPTPPVAQTSESNKSFVPLTKSVKAQVHSLEAKGFKVPASSSEIKAKKTRSRSENPPMVRGVRVSQDEPPPMPEKTRIHLKAYTGFPSAPRESSLASPTASTSRQSGKSGSSSGGGSENKIRKKKMNSRLSQSSHLEASSSRVNESRSRSRASGATEERLKSRRSRSMGALGPDHLENDQNIWQSRSAQNTREHNKHQSRLRQRNPPDDHLLHGKSHDRQMMRNPPYLIQTHLEEEFHHHFSRTPQPRFLPSGKMPSRQKSMLDLRESDHGYPRRQINPVPRPTPLLSRSVTELDMKRKSVNPKTKAREDLPPNVRRQMIVQEAAMHARLAASSGPINRHSVAFPPSESFDQDSFFMRQLNLEAQREFLMKRGFSQNHPFISGEISVHPELQGRLPFDLHGGPPTRTIPLRPEDYQRFRPELWLHPQHNHNPVAFNDLAVLKSELDFRKRREVHRQNSQCKKQNGAEFSPHSPPPSHGEDDSAFQSLPWEEIVSLQIQKSKEVPGPNLTSFAQERKKKQLGAGIVNWLNHKTNKQVSESKESQNGHWFLKEKSPVPNHNPDADGEKILSPNIMKSLPPLGSLKDSGIGEEKQTNSSESVSGNKKKKLSKENLSRTGTGRSSFGIILKDKLQNNPNIYFPESSTLTQEDHYEHSNDGGGSDSDTLLHNMSEGSYYEKESSSLSPHNSMEGSPRMIVRENKIEQISGPNQRKTIRNYMPKESSDRLRELEENQKNKNKHEHRSVDTSEGSRTESKTSVEKMIEDFHRNLPPPSFSLQQPPSSGPITLSEHASLSSKPNGTISSQNSNWSGASSSAASFDYQPIGHENAKKKSIPGAIALPALTEKAKKSTEKAQLPTFVQRIEVKAEVNEPPTSSKGNSKNQSESLKENAKIQQSRKHSIGPKESQLQSSKNKTSLSELSSSKSNSLLMDKRAADLGENEQDAIKKEVKSTSHVKATDMNFGNDEEDDDFSNLRKLISEGRIAGLNEKPPSFVPPTPPVTAKPIKKATEDQLVKPRRSSNKPPAPKPGETPQRRSQSTSAANLTRSGVHQHQERKSVEKQPSRKSREAPQPPVQKKSNIRRSLSSSPPTSSASSTSSLTSPEPSPMQTRESRLRDSSTEDLTRMDVRRVKRSPSHHETKRMAMQNKGSVDTAQLIADSTEKKFNFNPFKGMWKKKHYSFDFN